MKLEHVLALSCALLLAGCAASPAPDALPIAVGTTDDEAQSGLHPVASFAGIADSRERSIALFAEAAKVIQHPRCLNCHPATREPTQGDDLHPHQPPMTGTDSGHGPAGMACNTCHGADNVTTLADGIRSVPGNGHWMLAPAPMAWQGLSTAAICRQLLDPARNGNRDREAIHRHMTTDHLVAWAWHPGEGRTPAPGTQKIFGELIRAWLDSGAHCAAG